MSQPASAVALTGSDQTVRTSAANYAGFSIRETAGATAVVVIYDNTSASGTVLEAISLAANESAREFYPGGIWANTGIFVDVVSGAVAGSVRIA
jgi:F0F1-type ATP synthase alpha subunit